jgi:hypothetical protein
MHRISLVCAILCLLFSAGCPPTGGVNTADRRGGGSHGSGVSTAKADDDKIIQVARRYLEARGVHVEECDFRIVKAVEHWATVVCYPRPHVPDSEVSVVVAEGEVVDVFWYESQVPWEDRSHGPGPRIDLAE